MKYYSLKDLVSFIWNGKYIVVVCIVVSLLVGLAMFSVKPKVYNSAASFVIIEDSSSDVQRLSGLSALTGRGSGPTTGGISVGVYQNIVLSNYFLAQVAVKKVVYEGDTIFIGNYMAQKMRSGFKNEMKRGWKPDTSKVVYNEAIYTDYLKYYQFNVLYPPEINLVELSGELAGGIGGLRKAVSFSYEDSRTPLGIVVQTEDPYMSAVITRAVFEELEHYIYQLTKTNQGDNTKFLQEETNKAYKEMNALNNALTGVLSSTVNANLARRDPASQRLQVEYQQAVEKYTHLNTQLQVATMQEIKEKPLFLLLEQPLVSNINSPSAPRLVIFIALSVILGIVLSITILGIKQVVKKDLSRDK